MCVCGPSPVVVVGGQHHAGAGVGVAGDPGAVHGEHHQQHEHQHGDDGLDVGAQALLRLLLLRHMLAHLARLQGETSRSASTQQRHAPHTTTLNY